MVAGLLGSMVMNAQDPFDPEHPIEPGTYTVTITSSNASMGTVSGSGSYAQGTIVTISATPYSGYQFVQWSDGNTDNPRNITVDIDLALTAQFSTPLPLSVCLKKNSLEIVNNPCTGDIVFKNSLGVTVMTVEQTGSSQTIDFPGGWAAGEYRVELCDGEKAFTVEKK